MNYTLDIVTEKPDLWKDGDPVRPELGVSFKTYPGREVFGLRNESGEYVAFCCVAKTLQVPWDITSLSSFTANDGTIYVPYTVWSLKKGSGKAIINALLDKGASASEVSDQIKDLLFAKSASRVDGMKPNVANSMFGDQEVEPETDTEPKNEVETEDEPETTEDQEE